MMTIIIADDEPLLRYHLRSILSELDTKVDILEAENGVQLYEYIVEGRADAAFVDIRMPKLDGLEAMLRCKEEGIQIPWVVLSSHSEFNYAKKALELGALGYALKPPAPKEISALMENIQKELKSKHLALLKNFQYSWLSGNHIEAGKNLCIVPGIMQIEGRNLQNRKDQQDLSLQIQHHTVDILMNEQDTLCIGAVAAGNKPGSIKILIATEKQEQNTNYKNIHRIWNSLYARISAINAYESCRILCITGSETNTIEESDTLIQSLLELMSCRALLPTGITGYENIQELLLPLSSTEIKAAKTAARQVEAGLYQDAPEYRAAGMDLERELKHCSDVSAHRIQTYIKRLDILPPEQWQEEEKPSDTIDEICEYLLRHYNEKISLGEIAALFGLSPNYLSTLFHQRTGRTFVEYLTRIRMEKGREMLKSGKSVKECAWALGYGSERHFAQLYRKQFGIAAAAEKKTKS